MTTHILLCTVGSSHQPIVAAIDALKDRASRNGENYFVCFFCTEAIDGRPGSITQVTGLGKAVKANFNDPRPTLPNIPTQTLLTAPCFDACTVPPDNLDEAYVRMRGEIRKLSTKFESPRFVVADYTGGTKAMTAALVCAALESDDIDLEVVIGTRVNLISVSDGTHAAAAVDVSRMRTDRAVTRHLRAWERFAYRQAARTLRHVPIVAGTPGADRVLLARTLSEVLALWDDFDYEGASDLLDRCKSALLSRCSEDERQLLVAMCKTIELLASTDRDESEVLQLFDLWLNARRRAAQGRFDDAVSRWYRLMEWTAQWLLKTVLGVHSTAEFPRCKLPEGIDVPGEEDPVPIGMWKAWQVIGKSFPSDHKGIEGIAWNFMNDNHKELLNLIQTRNNSRLAHGFDPVTEQDWETVKRFTEQQVLPILRGVLKTVNLEKEPEQLPRSPPDFLLWP